MVHVVQGNFSSRFSRNYEANGSDFLENPERNISNNTSVVVGKSWHNVKLVTLIVKELWILFLLA